MSQFHTTTNLRVQGVWCWFLGSEHEPDCERLHLIHPALALTATEGGHILSGPGLREGCSSSVFEVLSYLLLRRDFAPICSSVRSCGGADLYVRFTRFSVVSCLFLHINPLTFVYLCFPLPQPFPPHTQQCVHNSETEASMKKKLALIDRTKVSAKRDPSVYKVYRFSQSSLSSNLDGYETPSNTDVLWPNLNSNYTFLKVVNEGTKQFEELGLQTYMEGLAFDKLARHVLGKVNSDDPNRTNKQDNLGWSCGENTQRKRDEIHNHHGSSMNQKNVGTDEFRWLFLLLSEIARKLGIPWANSDDVPCDLFQERNTIYAKSLDPNNCFEGVTIALLELASGEAKVTEHKDVYNDSLYTDTMVCNGIVHVNGKLYRVSVIAYLRKACSDSIVRRRACKETANASLRFLASVTSSRLPFATAQAASPFYNAVGEMGLALLVTLPEPLPKPSETGSHTSELKVHFASLLSRPHLDKPFGFLSSVSDVISKIYIKNEHMTQSDAIALCLPACHLNGVFTYLASLHSLLRKTHVMPHGRLRYFGTLLRTMTLNAGSYTSGSLPRCQVFFKDATIEVDRTIVELQFLEDLCEESREQPPEGTSYESFCRDRMWDITAKIAKNVHGCGLFGAHHIAGILAQLRLLRPVGVLHYARFATKTTTLSSPTVDADTPNPWMIRYLHHGCGANSLASRNDRARSVMDGVVSHLQIHHKIDKFTHAVLEQSNCETHRDMIAVDCASPLASTLHLPANTEDHRTLRRLTPAFDPKAKASHKVTVKSTIVEELEVRPEIFSGMEMSLETTVPIKNKEKVHRVSARIPLEFLTCFDGLLEEIQEMFFPQIAHSDVGSVFKRLEEHPVISQLAVHFAKHSQPLQDDLDFLERVGGGSVLREVEDNSPPRTARKRQGKMPKNFSSLASDRFISSLEDRCHSFLSGPVGLGMSVAPAYSISKKKYSGLSKRATVSDVTLSSSAASKQMLLAPIVLSGTKAFAFYRFLSPDMLNACSTKNFTMFNSHKKLVLGGKGAQPLMMGPLYVEVKAALFIGSEDSQVPLSLNKSMVKIKQIKMQDVKLIGNQASVSPSRANLFTAFWVGEAELPFSRANVCSMVDYLAETCGGSRVSVKGESGRIDWVFSSTCFAERHLLLCLLLLAGKPQYFAKLLYRVWKQLPREDLRSEKPCIVPIVCPTFPEDSTLFYAVLLPKSECPQGRKKKSRKKSMAMLEEKPKPSKDQQWYLCIGSSDSIGGGPAYPKMLDMWSWKLAFRMGGETPILPILSSVESSSGFVNRNVLPVSATTLIRKRRKRKGKADTSVSPFSMQRSSVGSVLVPNSKDEVQVIGYL